MKWALIAIGYALVVAVVMSPFILSGRISREEERRYGLLGDPDDMSFEERQRYAELEAEHEAEELREAWKGGDPDEVG